MHPVDYRIETRQETKRCVITRILDEFYVNTRLADGKALNYVRVLDGTAGVEVGHRRTLTFQGGRWVI